jgi:hypothetical protein
MAKPAHMAGPLSSAIGACTVPLWGIPTAVLTALHCAALRCAALHHWRNDWIISHRNAAPVPTHDTDMWRRRLSNERCCEYSSPLSRCAFG